MEREEGEEEPGPVFIFILLAQQAKSKRENRAHLVYDLHFFPCVMMYNEETLPQGHWLISSLSSLILDTYTVSPNSVAQVN